MLMEANGQFCLFRTVCFPLFLQVFGVVQCSIRFLTKGCKRLHCLVEGARIYGNGAPDIRDGVLSNMSDGIRKNGKQPIAKEG